MYVKTLFALALLGIPEFSHSMDLSNTTKKEAYAITDEAIHAYWSGKEVADVLITSAPPPKYKSTYYFCIGSWVQHLIDDYKSNPSLEHDHKCFRKYKAYYEGMIERLNNKYCHHPLNNENYYPLSPIIAEFAQSMLTKYSSMKEVVSAFEYMTQISIANELENIEKQANKAAELYLQVLEGYGRGIINPQGFSDTVRLYSTYYQAIESAFLKMSPQAEYLPEVILHFWQVFNIHFYRTICHCNIKEQYVKALQHIDMSTLNIEQITQLKNLFTTMEKNHYQTLNSLVQKLKSNSTFSQLISYLGLLKI